MTAIESGRVVAAVGTGTMGQGIAQVALVAGHPVRLYDTVPGRAEQAAITIAGRLDRLVEKGRLDAVSRDSVRARLHPASDLAEPADAVLVIEAVLEVLSVKRELFAAPEDIDTAMRLGVNYPRGPLDWGTRLGARWVLDTLEALHEEYPTGRYAPSQALRRLAAAAQEDDAS